MNLADKHNAAAIREALMALTDKLIDYLQKGLIQLPLPLEEATAKARAALSAPPRNCDVGTAQEQENRFIRFCEGKSSCKHCPLRNANSCCKFAWAQMPYKKEGAK